MNFFNKRYGQSFDQFDNNFDENWGENYYPNMQDFSQSYSQKEYGDDCEFSGKFVGSFRPCQNNHRPCGQKRGCSGRERRPCNQPCWEQEDDGNDWDTTPRPCNRPCHRPTRPNNNCNDALLFLSGYFIAKRCK